MQIIINLLFGFVFFINVTKIIAAQNGKKFRGVQTTSYLKLTQSKVQAYKVHVKHVHNYGSVELPRNFLYFFENFLGKSYHLFSTSMVVRTR